MIIWMLLAMSTLSAFASIALTSANREATEAMRASMRQHGVAGIPVGCLLAIMSFAALGLWTWYAVDVQNWRFAAIVWVPVVARWLGALTTKRRRYTS